MENELISVVVPCYNEQEVLPLFYETITGIAAEMSEKYDGLKFEFLFINDGSRDNTLELLREYSTKDERVRYVSFSRNFGKEAGIIAGLNNAKGDYVVTLDADLQHPPQLIPQMYECVSSGDYDCAGTRRISRKGEPKLISFFSRLFYKIINKISQTQIVEGAQDYRFMSRQMVDAIKAMPEYNRFSKGIFSWVGFKTKYFEVENVERAAGTTTWSFKKLFLYSMDGFSAFSTAPLSLASFLGVFFCAVAVISIIVVILKTLIVGESETGFPTLMCTILGLGGLQLLCIGILGQYLSKTYLETKERPKYIVGETEELYKKRVERKKSRAERQKKDK